MASLEPGLSFCSSAAAAHQVPSKSADEQGFSFMDLSFSDSGAAQYLLNHAPVEVTSAVLMGSEAAEQLCSTQAEATQQGKPHPVLQQWPGDFNTPLATPATHADKDVHADATASSATGPPDASHTAASTSSLSDTAAPVQLTAQPIQPCSTGEAPSGKSDQAGLPVGRPQHSLACCQALTAAVGAVNLVVGDLCSCAYQQIADGGRGAHQGGDVTTEAAGVLESEYSAAYRAGVLWECAVALSCLKPGEPLTQLSKACSQLLSDLHVLILCCVHQVWQLLRFLSP